MTKKSQVEVRNLDMAYGNLILMRDLTHFPQLLLKYHKKHK
jgi:hypothetical protein